MPSKAASYPVPWRGRSATSASFPRKRESRCCLSLARRRGDAEMSSPFPPSLRLSVSACEMNSRFRENDENGSLRPRQNPIDQLLYRRDKAVRIERVALESERGMTREHQVMLDRAAVRDLL